MHRLLRAPVAVLVLLLVVAGCGTATDPLRSSGQVTPKPEFLIGAPETAEGAVLAELYAGALRAEAITAGIEPVGARAEYLGQLRDGAIALVPDHTGELLTELKPDQAASTAAEVDEQLPAALGPQLAPIKPAPATAQVSYVITRTTADRHRISSLDDLAGVARGKVIGGPTDLPKQSYGPAALAAIYGVEADFKAYPDSAALARDLDAGTIVAGAFAANDPVLAGDSFVRLADPESIVLPQQITAVASADFTAHPTAVSAIEAV